MSFYFDTDLISVKYKVYAHLIFNSNKVVINTNLVYLFIGNHKKTTIKIFKEKITTKIVIASNHLTSQVV